WFVPRDCNCRRKVFGSLVFPVAMASCALCLGRSLMVADRAAARPFECKYPVTSAGLMTYEARDFLVPRMGKAVGRSSRHGGRPDSEVRNLRDRRCESEQCIAPRMWC